MKGRVGTRITLRPDHVPFNGLYERERFVEIRSIPFLLRLLLGGNRIMIRAVLELIALTLQYIARWAIISVTEDPRAAEKRVAKPN